MDFCIVERGIRLSVYLEKSLAVADFSSLWTFLDGLFIGVISSRPWNVGWLVYFPAFAKTKLNSCIAVLIRKVGSRSRQIIVSIKWHFFSFPHRKTFSFTKLVMI